MSRINRYFLTVFAIFVTCLAGKAQLNNPKIVCGSDHSYENISACVGENENVQLTAWFNGQLEEGLRTEITFSCGTTIGGTVTLPVDTTTEGCFERTCQYTVNVLNDQGDLIFSCEPVTLRWQERILGPGSIRLYPDPETHVKSDAVTVLPGDGETLFADSSALSSPCTLDGLFAVIEDTTVARFLKDGIFYDEVPLASVSEYLIYGKAAGENTKVYVYWQPENESEKQKLECLVIPVLVGGEIIVEFDGPPTFRVAVPEAMASLLSNSSVFASMSSAFALPQASPNQLQSQDAPPAFTPFQPFAFAGIGNSDRVVVDIGDPVEIPMATLTDMYINRQRDAKIQIQVVDTLGDVKRNKLVVIRPHKLGLEITGESMITDHEGRVSGVVVRSVSEGLPNVAVIQYQLTVACRRPSGLNQITEDYWRAVGNSNDGSSDLTRWQNGMSTTPYFQPYHENTYGKLRVRNTFPSASDQLHMPAGSFLLPALNGVLYGVHEKWLIGSDSGSPYVYGAQELRGVIDGYHVENYFYPLGSSNPYRVQNIDKLMQPFENAGFTTFSPVDQRDEFSYAALAYEFAFEVGKAVTPGADAFDLTVEYAWKPFVKDEPPNHIVGLLSAAGLLMDLGHLIPGAGTAASTAGNVVVGVLRFAIRHVDDWGPAGKAFLSGLVAIGGTAKQTIIVLFKYVEKIPGDPVEKVSMLLRTWDSLVRGAWQFSGDAVAKTVKKLSGRSVWYKKEAQIGLTRFMHAGKETFTDTVLEYGDEVAEKTFELLSFTDEAGSFLVDLAKFSDEAVEGLAKFLKNADSAVGDSGEIAAKLLRLDDVAKNDIFKKINTWVDDPAAGVSLAESCAGLKKLVNKAEIGPQEISEVFRQLGENSGQGYIGSAGKTLEYVRSGVPHPDTGLKMVQDSLSALKATPTNRLVDQQVLAELGGAIPSMKEFHALRNLDVGSLTTAQKAKLTDIRSMIPAPGPDEVLSKVVRFNQIDEFITRPDLPIGGFVSKQADVTDLSTATQLYDNLRLDYGDGPILNDGLGLVEFPRPLNVECGIPTKPNIDLDYPYSGNGFLSTKSARVQPEWVMSYEPFPLGSQLFQIDPFGNRVLRAVRVQDGWQIILPFTP